MAQLGDKVQDQINGFSGIVTGRCEYLYGCVQLLVAPMRVEKDGKHPDSVWLDEDRVSVMKTAQFRKPASARERLGGPAIGPLPPGR